MLGSFFVIFRSILEPPPQPPISPQDSKVACREVTCQCQRNSTVLSRPASSALNENEIFAAVMSQKCQICHHICSVAKNIQIFGVLNTRLGECGVFPAEISLCLRNCLRSCGGDSEDVQWILKGGSSFTNGTYCIRIYSWCWLSLAKTLPWALIILTSKIGQNCDVSAVSHYCNVFSSNISGLFFHIKTSSSGPLLAVLTLLSSC